MKPSTRIAAANATAFLLLWLLFCYFAYRAMPYYLWWDPHHVAEAVASLLFTSLLGASVVFWRVRTAYRVKAATVDRAIVEGLVFSIASWYLSWAVMMFAVVLMGYMTWADIQLTLFNGDIWDGVRPVAHLAALGTTFAVVMWAANRFAIPRMRALESIS